MKLHTIKRGLAVALLAALSLIALLAVTTQTALAQSHDRFSQASCPAVDLRKQLGPVRNQKGTGWCHSFTAADLLTAKLGWEVSATDIARNYYVNRDFATRVVNIFTGNAPTDFGGTTAGALDAAISSGVCGERYYPYELVRTVLGSQVESISKEICDSKKARVDGLFTVEKRVVSYGTPDAERYAQEQLRRGNLVGIDYNVFKILSESRKQQFAVGEAGHASSIVAMRPSARGGCEYLIRGSWGAQCNSYGSGYACEDGNVWVSGNDLSWMTYAIAWIEDRR